MAKRYLGGGVSFEQKDVYQEFSEDEGGGGSSTLSGLTDVDISNPSDGQTLVYNAETGKWENGTGGGGGSLTVNVTVHDPGEATEYAIMDKTAGEIMTAINAGTPVIFRQTETLDEGTIIYFGAVSYVETFEAGSDMGYVFNMASVGASDFYHAEYGCLGASGYPSTQQVGGE